MTKLSIVLIVLLLPSFACRATVAETATVNTMEPQKQGKASGKKPKTQKPAPKSSAKVETDPFASLKPLPSGAGIIVCAPIPANANSALAALGDGYQRILQWHLGNIGELGKMPDIDRVFETARELRLTHLRLTEKEALAFARVQGVSHVAVGTIEGDPQATSLTYRLLTVATGAPAGDPFVITGTREQIAKTLPQTVQKIAKYAGVTSPALNFDAGLTPDDVEAIGRYSWIKTEDLYAAEVTELAKAAEHEPLADFILWSRSQWISDAQEAAVKARIAKVVPSDLTLLYMTTATCLLPVREYAGAITEWHTKYPNNFITSYLMSRLKRTLNDNKAEQAATERTLCCALQNPQGWLTFSTFLSNIAQNARQSRPAGEITDEEMASLQELYAVRLLAAERVVKLHPKSRRGWTHVAEAATFAGDGEKATAAFWKALELDPNNYTTLHWGTEMFQPKWLDNAEELNKVLVATTQAQFLMAEEALAMNKQVGSLEVAGIISTDQKFPQSIINSHTRQYQAMLQQNPNSVLALRNLTILYGVLGSKKGAEEYHRQWVARGPKRLEVEQIMPKLKPQ